MARKLTHEEYVKKMNEVHPTIEVIGEYINSKTKVPLKCKVCNHEWSSKIGNSIQNKRGCPECSKKRVAESNRRTHEEYLNEMNKLHPNIEVLGKYVNNNTKVELRCKIDGYEWSSVPASSINRKNGCPKCNGGRALTHEEYIEMMSELHPNIEVLGKYVKSAEKVQLKCKIDGHEWKAAPNTSLSRKAGCPACARRKTSERMKTITNDEYIRRINEIHPNIEILGEYNGLGTKVKLKCKIDGHEWEATPGNSIHLKRGCPKCGIAKSSNAKKYTHDYYIEKMNELHPNIEVLGKYKGMEFEVQLKCKIDGHEWKALPLNSIHHKKGCMKCAGHLQKTHEEYLYAMNEVHPSIEVLGKYVDIKTKVPLKCKVCEHEWSSVPYASIHQKTGCPKCNNNSKQEKILFEYIKEHYKEVKSQVTFDGLVGVGGGLLSYDIGLSLNGIDYLIERQGEQHEKPIPFGGITKERAIINFEIQKEHDRRKREYAKENGYTLIEIWYNEDYKEKLKQYGLCA